MIEIALVETIFFFNDTATTEIYTLSLHDALPICTEVSGSGDRLILDYADSNSSLQGGYNYEVGAADRSEEHTSELQSRPHISYAVFCLKKKTNKILRLS